MEIPIPGHLNPLQFLSFMAYMNGMDDSDHENEQVTFDADEPDEEIQRPSAEDARVKRFKQMRAKFTRGSGLFTGLPFEGSGMTQSSFSFNVDTKPDSETRPLRSLKPMIGDELNVGATSHGRYLCGWVAIDDAFFGIASSILLIEDVAGSIVEIGVYRLVDENLPPQERQRRVAAQFPKGKAVAVLEPFYKVRMDGNYGVRVDNPEEIVAWSAAPSDLMAWKELGNEFFGVLNDRNEGRGALACYRRALDCIKPVLHENAILLTNMAICRFKMGDNSAAILLSGAAVHLDPTCFEGWLCLTTALVESKKPGAAKRRLAAQRVVTHALNVVPSLSSDEKRKLAAVLSKSSPPADTTMFQSYTEWCLPLESPCILLSEWSSSEVNAERSVDYWRQEGYKFDAKGNFESAERCYRQGLAQSEQDRRDVSVVLNDVAATHLKLLQLGVETPSDVSESTKTPTHGPPIEAALLSCTVAGILDPTNYKAWTLRVQCLEKMGFTSEECAVELQSISTGIASATSATSAKCVEEFKTTISPDVLACLSELTEEKAAHPITDLPLHQRRNANPINTSFTDAWGDNPKETIFPSDLLDGDEEEIMDRFIFRVEDQENRLRTRFTINSRQHRRFLFPQELVRIVSDSPPKIHLEFPRLRGWPKGINSTFATKELHCAYLYAAVVFWFEVLDMRTGHFFIGKDPREVFNRWHGFGALAMLAERPSVLQVGEVVDGREADDEFVPSYESTSRSSFARNFSRKEVYSFGTTHMAIGFKDLSTLLNAIICEKADTSDPLRFVGFERSEFAVAKFKVVAYMLGCPDVAITSVMEVWFSSTWSEATLNDFRKSVGSVLESLNEQRENAKVMSYLSHWASADPISAATARSEFCFNTEQCNNAAYVRLCSYCRQIDRLDLAQYLLTGEIRASTELVALAENEDTSHAAQPTARTSKAKRKSKSKKKRKQTKTKMKKATEEPCAEPLPLVGSLTMWSAPPGAPPLRESVAINTTGTMTLLELYDEQLAKPNNVVDALSVVDLFVIHVMRNLHRLRGLLLENKLVIDVLYGVVKAFQKEGDDLERDDLVSRIAMMRPHTISWSNVVDYFMPEDFHDLARRCSKCGNCIHYGYSVKWPTQVVGASILDFSPRRDSEVIDAVLDAAVGLSRQRQVRLPLQPVPMFKLAGLEKLLVFPIREDPVDSTTFVLAQLVHEKWVEHFFRKGELTSDRVQRLGLCHTPSNCGLHKGAVELSIPNALGCSSPILHMTWSYDPNLPLSGANNLFDGQAVCDRNMIEHILECLNESRTLHRVQALQRD